MRLWGRRIGRGGTAVVAVLTFLAFAVGGVTAIVLGTGLIGDAEVLEQRGVTVAGTVVDRWTSTSYEPGTPGTPGTPGSNGMPGTPGTPGTPGHTTTETHVSIRFSTSDGVSHTFSRRGSEDVGAAVTVWFDPENPDQVATTGTPDARRWSGIVLAVLGGAFVLGGIVMGVAELRDPW